VFRISRFIERIQRELNLTPAQREQVLQIVQDTRLKVENLRPRFPAPAPRRFGTGP